MTKEAAIEERAKKFLDIQSYGALIPETRRMWTAWLVGFAQQEITAAGYESACEQWTAVEDGLPTRDDWYPVRVDDGVNPTFQTCAYFNGEEFEVYQVVAWFDVPSYQQGGE